MEQRKKAWSERILTEEEPPSKQARSTTTTGGYNVRVCVYTTTTGGYNVRVWVYTTTTGGYNVRVWVYTTTTGGYNASTCTARFPLLYTCSFAWAMVGWDTSPFFSFYFLKASVLCTCISIHVLIISFLSGFLYR